MQLIIAQVLQLTPGTLTQRRNQASHVTAEVEEGEEGQRRKEKADESDELTRAKKPPKAYRRRLVPLHAKFGVDFSRYNHTLFAGLENGLRGSWANALWQALVFVPPIRVHVHNRLHRDASLTSELAYLLHKLDHAPLGSAVEPRNLLRQVHAVLDEAFMLRRNEGWARAAEHALSVLLTQLALDEKLPTVSYTGTEVAVTAGDAQQQTGKLLGQRIEQRTCVTCSREGTSESSLTTLRLTLPARASLASALTAALVSEGASACLV